MSIRSLFKWKSFSNFQDFFLFFQTLLINFVQLRNAIVTEINALINWIDSSKRSKSIYMVVGTTSIANPKRKSSPSYLPMPPPLPSQPSTTTSSSPPSSLSNIQTNTTTISQTKIEQTQLSPTQSSSSSSSTTIITTITNSNVQVSSSPSNRSKRLDSVENSQTNRSTTESESQKGPSLKSSRRHKSQSQKWQFQNWSLRSFQLEPFVIAVKTLKFVQIKSNSWIWWVKCVVTFTKGWSEEWSFLTDWYNKQPNHQQQHISLSYNQLKEALLINIIICEVHCLHLCRFFCCLFVKTPQSDFEFCLWQNNLQRGKNTIVICLLCDFDKDSVQNWVTHYEFCRSFGRMCEQNKGLYAHFQLGQIWRREWNLKKVIIDINNIHKKQKWENDIE